MTLRSTDIRQGLCLCLLRSPREMGSSVLCVAVCCTILIGKGTINVFPLGWTEQMNDATHADTMCTLFMSQAYVGAFEGLLVGHSPSSLLGHITTENVSGSAQVFLIL